MSQRWAPGTGRTPGGVPGAWFNVVLCAVIGIGAPIAVLSRHLTLVYVLFAVALVLICAYMEIRFVRTLISQRERVRRSRE